MLIQYISQPATPEAKISHIGLIFRKYTPAKVMAHIMILMLFPDFVTQKTSIL